MFLANGWQDYEVIDTSGGEKLERWGDYTLIRPDRSIAQHQGKTRKGYLSFPGIVCS